MSDNFKDAEENLQNFLEKHGTDGFLKLFYTHYLFDLVTYYIQTNTNQQGDNPSYLYHFDIKGNPFSTKQIDNFNKKLQTVCSEHALKIIDSLKTQTDFNDLVAKPLDINSEDLLDTAFKEIIVGFDNL